MVVTEQPIAGDDGEGTELPDSLRELEDMDYVRIRQKVEWCELCCCKSCVSENSYSILTSSNRKLFEIKEDSNVCTRRCPPTNRPLDLQVKDAQTGETVARFGRPLRCDGSCCWCCCCFRQSMEAYAPVRHRVGDVTQKSCSGRKFVVSSADGELTLEGARQWCVCGCCWGLCCRRGHGYNIMRNGEQIGQIRKEFTVVKEAMTDADNFYMTFPRDLKLDTKLTLLGGVLLLDYMFFEGRNDDDDDAYAPVATAEHD